MLVTEPSRAQDTGKIFFLLGRVVDTYLHQCKIFLLGHTGSSKTRGKKMTTVETAKAIRAELKAIFPGYKFSVRKRDTAVINIEYNGDPVIRETLDAIARKYIGWTEFNTDYVWVNAYGKASA